MKSKDLEEYRNKILKYVDNVDGNESIDELIEIFISDIYICGTNEAINELLPILKYYIKKNIKKFGETGCDLFFVTQHPELFSYTLSFANEVDVIGLMLEYADGLEEYYTIEELMLKNNLSLPKIIIDKYFSHLTDESKENLIKK